jgi:hypothetical protein
VAKKPHRKPRRTHRDIPTPKATVTGLIGGVTYFVSFAYMKIMKEPAPPEMVVAFQSIASYLAVYYTPPKISFRSRI